MKLLITLALCAAALVGCATVPAAGYYGSRYVYDSGPGYGYYSGRAYYYDRGYYGRPYYYYDRWYTYGRPYYRGYALNYDHDFHDHGQ
jgi:hypothetical protein